jgi:hypothetical protein
MIDITSRIENFRAKNFTQLQKSCKSKNMIFTAKQLGVPLPPDTIVAKFYTDKLGSLRFAIPCIYRVENELVIALPDFAQSPLDFELISVKANSPVSAIVTITDNDFTVAISLDADYRDSFIDAESDIIIDAVDFDTMNVNELPTLEIPLKNLEWEVFTAKLNGHKSVKYGDLLANLISKKTGLTYKNVICNAHLKSILADGKEHQVTIVSQQKSKSGGVEVILFEK